MNDLFFHFTLSFRRRLLAYVSILAMSQTKEDCFTFIDDLDNFSFLDMKFSCHYNTVSCDIEVRNHVNPRWIFEYLFY